MSCDRCRQPCDFLAAYCLLTPMQVVKTRPDLLKPPFIGPLKTKRYRATKEVSPKRGTLAWYKWKRQRDQRRPYWKARYLANREKLLAAANERNARKREGKIVLDKMTEYNIQSL